MFYTCLVQCFTHYSCKVYFCWYFLSAGFSSFLSSFHIMVPISPPFKLRCRAAGGVSETRHCTTRGRVARHKWGNTFPGTESNLVWTQFRVRAHCAHSCLLVAMFGNSCCVPTQLITIFISCIFFFFKSIGCPKWLAVPRLCACLPCSVLCKKESYARMLTSRHVYFFSLGWLFYIHCLDVSCKLLCI